MTAIVYVDEPTQENTMNAMLVIKTANGYVAMPYNGEIPLDGIANLRIANAIRSSYSYGSVALADVLSEHFEPSETVTELKAA